jgi:hypothetical protein
MADSQGEGLSSYCAPLSMCSLTGYLLYDRLGKVGKIFRAAGPEWPNRNSSRAGYSAKADICAATIGNAGKRYGTGKEDEKVM